MVSKRTRKNSGRYTPKYTENLPFHLREELDIVEERTLYDEWDNYRDGFRTPLEKNKIKHYLSRGKRIPNHFIIG